MKRLFVVLMAALLVVLTACGHSHMFSTADCEHPAVCKCGEVAGEALGHTFKPATCTEPAVCERCGRVEGEAFGHELSEATYQSAQVCAACGVSVGEKLEADFEKYGITKFLSEGETGYFNTVNGNGTDSPVQVTVKSYEIVKTDEERPEREGYEWHTVNFECNICDATAVNTGFNISYFYTDYYTIKEFRDSADHSDEVLSKLMVNHNGSLAPIWLGQAGGYERNDDGSVTFRYMVSVQKPIGYDGVVVGLNTGKFNLSVDDRYFNEVYNETEFALVRIKA